MGAVKKLDAWLPPLVVMAVIFFFSAQPNLNSGLGVIDHVGRKFVHASEDALLCFLWWRALRTKLDCNAALACAWAIATLYAATDEYHQGFVAGRHSTWVDVAIDSMGAALFVALVLRASHRKELARGPPPRARRSSRCAQSHRSRSCACCSRQGR